jgi:hypothetical protein
MVVILVVQNLERLLNVGFRDRLNAFGFYIIRQDLAEPVAQKGLAAGFKVNSPASFQRKRLAGLFRILAVEILDFGESKWRNFDLIGYIEGGDFSSNVQLGDIADADQSDGINRIALAKLVG